MVYNNYFQTDDWFSINLMNHPADPLDTIMIVHNSFVASGPILGGRQGEHSPKNVTVINNLFLHPTIKIMRDPTGLEHSYGNLADANEVELPKGINKATVTYAQNEHGLFQLQEIISNTTGHADNWTLLDIPTLDDDPKIVLDIMQQEREPGRLDIGCQIPGAAHLMKPYVSAENTGPVYLKK